MHANLPAVLRFAATAGLLAAVLASGAGAQEPRAARSVHLHWRGPEAAVFANAVTVRESQNGTYFCVCGFGHGYFGIQQLGSPDQKVVLFSVWDPGEQNDPKSVPEARRVEVLYQAPDVEVRRFGGEGTGAQSFYRLAWKPGETYRFAIRAEAAGERTAYTAYLYLNDRREWKRLATFRTLSGGELIKGFYSFVEDFRRDGASPKQRRAAVFSDGWAQTKEGYWVALNQATFTGDSTPLLNVNASTAPTGFLLETGGDVKNIAPLNSRLSREPAGLPPLPAP